MTLKQDYRICCFCPAVIRLHHSNRRPRLRLPPSSDVVVPQTTPGCRRQSSSFLLVFDPPTLLPLLLLLLYFSLPSLRPKVFLFPPLAVEEGRVSLLRDSAEQTQERVKFPDFPRKFPPINWFTSNVYRAANELLLPALVLSSELQIRRIFPSCVPRISRTKFLLTHKLPRSRKTKT